MLYLGIDNGATGGIAVLHEDGSVYRVDKTPPTDAELLSLLQVIAAVGPAHAVLEFAQVFPKMGVSSAGSYIGGYRAMQMGLLAAGIPFDLVVPRKWQAAMSCLSGGEKNITKNRAQQLFPKLTVTHAIADALIMAEFCRRKRLGIL